MPSALQWVHNGFVEPQARESGLEQMGSVPWGTHFCHFFATRDDLLETLVPYFVAGLQGGEQCFWLVAEPLHLEDARAALVIALAAAESVRAARPVRIEEVAK